MIAKKQEAVDIGKIFSLHGRSFSQKHPQSEQGCKVINLIKACRTSTLGGHIQACLDCGYSKPMYNSCRCRFCPKCQTLTKERWLEKRKSEFIDTDYYHGVFTIPSELNALARQNQKIIYSILFKSVSETLQTFSQTEYKGQLGFISVLHTWNQKLNHHIHLHCVIPGGVILNESKKWKRLKNKKFLFPVLALSQVFKSKFISLLREKASDLELKGDISYLQHDKGLNDFLDHLYSKDWVVYAKKSFGGAMQVVEYLGRYMLNFHSRAMRGLRNGGSTVLGFKIDPTNKSILTANKKEVPLVKTVFEIYINEGSLNRTAAKLREMNIQFQGNAGTSWNVQTLSNLLRNQSYIGMLSSITCSMSLIAKDILMELKVLLQSHSCAKEIVLLSLKMNLQKKF